MSVRLFVGNLPYDATEADLREHFSAVAPLSYIYLPLDRETGKPRGFAFIEYSERSHAVEAIRRFDSQMFKGRPLAVNEARAKEDRPAAALKATRLAVVLSGKLAARPAAPAGGKNFGPDAAPRGRTKTLEGRISNPSADLKAPFAKSQVDNLSLEATKKKSTMMISAATTSPAV